MNNTEFLRSLLDDSQGGAGGAVLFIKFIIVCILLLVLKECIKYLYKLYLQPVIQPVIAPVKEKMRAATEKRKAERRERRENAILEQAEKIATKRKRKAFNAEYIRIAEAAMAGKF